MITHRASESVYCNGLSRLPTTRQARPIRKFLNWPITFELNRNGQFESNLNSQSFTGPYPSVKLMSIV